MSLFFLRHPKETDLALFAGGELGPMARWRIERHLESCDACQAQVADFFRLESELSPLAELPDVDWNSLAESIEARVADARASGATAPSRPAVPTWGLGLAAACAAAVVAVGLWNADFRATAPASSEAVLAETPPPAISADAVVSMDTPVESEALEAPAVAQSARSASAPTEKAAPEAVPARQVAQSLGRSDSASAVAEETLEAEPAGARERRQVFADQATEPERPALAGDIAAPAPPVAPASAARFRAFRAEYDEAEAAPGEVRRRLQSLLASGGRAGLEQAMTEWTARESELTPDELRWLTIYREEGLDSLIATLSR